MLIDYPAKIKEAGLNGFEKVVKKTVDELANEVLASKWGNGVARKKALLDAGYDYDAVQAKVNEILVAKKKKPIEDIAREIVRGKWGNGTDRVTRLKNAGYTAKEITAIQDRVNELM